MVGSIVPTSTWSHNCGMHVIADYMVEKINQDNFQEVFNGKAYDELLDSFKKIYKQEDLTWKSIRKAIFKVSRIDSQIIWGYALRMMMPAVAENNEEYKIDLYNSFLAAMNLYKTRNFEELQRTYPIIFFANETYFKAEELNSDVDSDKYLDYWNEKGFKNYCSALIHIIEENKSFLWLSKEEVSIFCQYFNFEFDFEDQLDAAADLDPKKLYFSNSSQTHWERKVASSHLAPAPAASQTNSEFFEQFLTKGVSNFLSESNVLGEIFFSDLYSDPKLGLEFFKNIQDESLKKCLISKDKNALADYVIKNQDHKKILSDLLEFSIVYFDCKELMDWLKSSELNRDFSSFYQSILLGAVKYQKQEIFNQLLTDFSKEYTASVCMPVLMYATKQNETDIVKKILAMPDFNHTGFINEIFASITPAYFNDLNQFDEHGIPALYYAIKNHNTELTKLLLDKGASPEYKLRVANLKKLGVYLKNTTWLVIVEMNAFGLALELENPEMIVLLSKYDPKNLHSPTYNYNGNNATHLFARQGKISLIEQIKNKKLNLNSRDAMGKNCLHISAEIGNLEGIKFCHKKGIHLYAKDNYGNTALHLAVSNGHFDAVKVIVEKLNQHNVACFTRFQTCDLDQKNTFGLTALNLAYKAEHHDIVDYLKSQGCTDVFQDMLDELTKNFFSPIFDAKAFATRHQQVMLLADRNRNTLLHYVCGKYDNTGSAQKLIRELIWLKANIQAKNNEGLTPLHIAAKINHVQAIEELLEQGAFIDFITPTGLSACHFAAIYDNKEAFILLKEKGASLTLKAYPAAAAQLVIKWDGKRPLTPIQLAEYNPEKKVYNYLKDSHLISEPEIKYKSTSHWVLTKAEDALGLKNHYVSSTFAETYKVEKTKTYKIYSSGKILIVPLCKIPLGLGAVGIEAAKQLLLYGYPILAGRTDKFYYYLKPVFHNYMPSRVSTGFDYLSMAGSALVYSPFTAMNAFDLFYNSGRRAAGLTTSIGLLKLAQFLSINNKEVQALSYIVGKELGFSFVDSYHETTPEKKLYKFETQNSLNSSLNHTYEIWTSLLGKTTGERVVYTANYIHECQMAFYENVGDAEHQLVDKLPEFRAFKETINSASAFFLGDKPGAYLSESAIVADIDYFINTFVSGRDELLFKIEKAVAENVFSHSNYQQLVLSHLHKMQGIIYAQQAEEAKAKLKLAEESGQVELVSELTEQIIHLENSMKNAAQLAKEFYEKTPKGKKSTEYHEAKQQKFKTGFDVHHLENLKKMNIEGVLDKAYEDLGEEYTPHAILQYLETTMKGLGLQIEQQALTDFKLGSDVDNLKPLLSEFLKKHLENHILSNEKTIFEKYHTDVDNLKQHEVEFKTYASPEELRVLNLEEENQFTLHQYQVFSKQEATQIHDKALLSARYANFIHQSQEYEGAERESIQSNSYYDQVKIQNEAEIIRINKTYESVRISFEASQKTLDFDSLYESVSSQIVTGKEDGKIRKEVTAIMIDRLVGTGLISYEEAIKKYNHDFYTSLTFKIDTLKSHVQSVFEKATNDIIDSSKKIIASADKQLAELNSQIEQAYQNKLHASEKASYQKSQFQAFEQSSLQKLSTAEQADFKDYANDLKGNITNLNAFNKLLNEQKTVELNITKEINKQDEIVTLIQSNEAELAHLTTFKLTPQKIHELVNNAFDTGSDVAEVNKYIIDYFVKNGVGSYEQLRQSLWNTLTTAQNADSASGRKDHLRKRLESQTEVIQKQYIPAQIIKLNQNLSNLKEKQIALKQELATLKENQQVLQEQSARAQKQYVEKLSDSDREKFEEMVANTVTEQKEKLAEIQTVNLFSNVGQAQLVLESANYQDFLSDEGQSAFRVSYSVAKNLLAYKYQFLPKPGDIAYQQELDQITHSIHRVNQARAIDEAKLNIDKSIATFVHTQALSTGKSVPAVLKDLLQSDIFNSNEEISALSTLDLQQAESSISSIQNAIYQQVKNISIANMGEHDIQAVWAPKVPKRAGKMHRMTRNIKNAYHDNREVIIAAAILAAAMALTVATGGFGAAVTVQLNGFIIAGQGATAGAGAAGIGASGAAGALGGVLWRSNNAKGQEPSILEKMAPRRYDNQYATQRYLQQTENIAAQERQTNNARLASFSQRNTNTGAVPQSVSAAHQKIPAVAHVPSLANSVFQGGAFGEAPQSFPGPLRLEHLPEEVKNPTSTQFFVPFGYQNTNNQPEIAPLPPEQESRTAPETFDTSNMMNGWGGQAHAQPMQNMNSEQTFGFLPGYSKLMHPEVNQGTSSAPQEQPVPIIPLVLPVVAPRRKEDAESSHSASLKTESKIKPLPSAATPSKTYLPSQSSTLATNTQKPSATPYPLSKDQLNMIGEPLIHKQGLAQEYLFACGGRDPLVANACINTAYHALAQQNPYLQFPMATSGASAIVGKALAAAMFPAGLNHDATVSIKQLTYGNQLIFKDLFPLLKTYQDEGFKGIEKLQPYLLQEYKSGHNLIEAFRQQHALEQKANVLAEKMKLPPNDIRVINQFFSDASNRDMALDIAMNLVTHEQIRVQEMYTDEFVKIIKDPLNIMVAKGFRLSQTINGKEFTMSSLNNPGDVNERINLFFKPIFTEIIGMYATPVKLDQYYKQMNRQVEVSILNSAPHGISKEDPITYWQHKENALYRQQMRDWANGFASELTLPQVEDKKLTSNNRGLR